MNSFEFQLMGPCKKEGYAIFTPPDPDVHRNKTVLVAPIFVAPKIIETTTNSEVNLKISLKNINVGVFGSGLKFGCKPRSLRVKLTVKFKQYWQPS